MKPSLTNIVIATALFALACGQDTSNGDVNAPGHESLRSTLARNQNPTATPEEMSALAEGNHQLTLELYRATVAGDDNWMLSTLSIQTAFSLVYAGARTTTAQEISSVLHFDTDQARWHQAMNALDLALASRELPGDPDNSLEPVELRQANAFWGQIAYPWRNTYLDILAQNYGAGIEVLDLMGESERSRGIINEWVEERTNDRIKDLLPAGSIKSNTVAVLTNALYFKAPWLTPFEDGLTTTGTFSRVDDTTVTADFMSQLEDYGYASGAGWTAVELPYRGEALSMVVIIPDAGTFRAFDSSLSSAQLGSIVDALETASVELTLPKFEFETGFTLSQALRDLGMVESFGNADLSGMIDDTSLFIDEAYHKTFIAVDEKGTEAAAATAVVIGETSVPVADFTVRVDRPFYFLIRDRATNVWLFFGRVMDP